MCDALWLEDDQDITRTQKPHLEREGFRIKVETDPRRGLRALKNKRFSLVITDLKMQPMDGIKFMRRVNEDNPDVGIVVLSGFADDYREQLKKVRYDYLLKKPIPHLAQENRFKEYIAVLRKAADPLLTSHDEYLEMSDEKKMRIDNRIWRKHRAWILKELKRRRAEWVLICGHRVVRSSASYEKLPTEKQLRRVAAKTKLAPFIFCRPSLIEESSWSSVGTTKNPDYYPTIMLEINDVSWNADFDTGAQVTCVSDKVVGIDFQSPRSAAVIHNREYLAYRQLASVKIKDEDGLEVVKRNFPLKVIQKWERSNFVLVNKGRKILAGRDLLLNIPMEVRLEGNPKLCTRVLKLKFN